VNLNHKLINHFKLLAIACTLSACGGGGGGNDLHLDSAPSSIDRSSGSGSGIDGGNGAPLPSNLTLSANVVGLEETSGLVLKVKDKEIAIKKPGTTALASDIPVGNSFNVSIQKQPEDFQWCSIQNNMGVISGNGNMVDIACTTSGVEGTTLARATDGATYRDGTLATAAFKQPGIMVMDQTGNSYIYDQNFVVRKISPDGTVVLYTGRQGVTGTLDGSKGTATISSNLAGMAIDKDGIIYFTDTGGLIRKIAKDGSISTFFKMSDHGGAVSSLVGKPSSLKGLVFDSVGNLFVVDNGKRVVYKIASDKTITKFAGKPYSSTTDYAAIDPAPRDGGPDDGQFSTISGIAIDADDNLYVADAAHGYRKIDRAGVISTPAPFTPSGGLTIKQITMDKYKNIYLSGSTSLITSPITSALIIKITPNGKISMLAGKSGTLAGYADGVNSEFMLNNDVRGLIFDQNGQLIISDGTNNAIRKIIPAAP
jgi:sugar lactone lactonase YvrE